jgi:hypothetical protein
MQLQRAALRFGEGAATLRSRQRAFRRKRYRTAAPQLHQNEIHATIAAPKIARDASRAAPGRVTRIG